MLDLCQIIVCERERNPTLLSKLPFLTVSHQRIILFFPQHGESLQKLIFVCTLRGCELASRCEFIPEQSIFRKRRLGLIK